jgi:adenosylcobinamide-GDP ribazoletransferase
VNASLDDIRACLLFYTRLAIGVGPDGHAMPDFSRACWAAPVAGALIGAIGGVVLSLAAFVTSPPMVSATAAVCALAFITGALHEDGLADVADGFGGGRSREEKLAIMRDSRLGSYGVLALCLSTLFRVSALAAMLEAGSLSAVLALIGASALSRALGLLPLVRLPSARGDGAGFAAARPSSSALRMALCIGVVFALAPALGGVSLAHSIIAIVAAVAAAAGVTSLAARQIGGYTGDVLGAAQQATEIAFLAALSAG